MGDISSGDVARLEALGQTISGAEAGATFHEIVSSLDGATLSDAERERLARLFWAKADAASVDLAATARAAGEIRSAVLRNTIATLLPADYRRQLYNLPAGAAGIATRQEATQSVEPQPALALRRVRIERTSFVDVLALTTEDDLATRRLLDAEGFSYHRASTVAEARQMLSVNRDICAIIIDESTLKPLGAVDQRSLIREVAGYSTFTVLKLDEAALRLSNPEVAALMRESECSLKSPDILRIVLRSGAGLQQRDLRQIHLSSERLAIGVDSGLYAPGDVTESQLRLIASSLHAYTRTRDFAGAVELHSINARFIYGGFSEAKVAVARINNNTAAPVVIKINNKSDIIDEARRFYKYILPDNLDLAPEVYFHAGDALIIFGIIAESEIAAFADPAPTLAATLKRLWFCQLRGKLTLDMQESTAAAFRQAVQRLKVLNAKAPTGPDPSLANPYLDTLRKLEKSGFSWGFPEGHLNARAAAESVLGQERLTAVCHGDSHTRNILVRRDQGYLIDYALSGPGHPAADLARLELSIFFSVMHPFGTSEDWIKLQRDISYSASSFDVISTRYAGILACATNRLGIQMCIEARDACMDVLAGRGLDASHYHAAKLLLAWQCLISPDFQQTFVRVVIDALSAD